MLDSKNNNGLNNDRISMAAEVAGNTNPATTAIRARHFQLTINNLSAYEKVLDYLLNLKSLRYLLACKETAPSTGKEHVHIYANFINTIRLSLKKTCGAHVECCRGSPKQNIDYIRKDGNIIYEYGEEPKQGKINFNYDEIKNLTTKDILDNEDLGICHKKMLLNIKKEIDQSEPLKASDFLNQWSKFDDLNVFYICGESGSGKSQMAKKIVSNYVAKNPDANIDLIKYDNGFYNGATGKSEIGFYDEFRDSHMKASEFINLIDYNKHNMNIKGSKVMNNYKLIIITSIIHPKNIYCNMPEETKEQWLRRIKIINMSTSNVEERINWDNLIKF